MIALAIFAAFAGLAALLAARVARVTHRQLLRARVLASEALQTADAAADAKEAALRLLEEHRKARQAEYEFYTARLADQDAEHEARLAAYRAALRAHREALAIHDGIDGAPIAH